MPVIKKSEEKIKKSAVPSTVVKKTEPEKVIVQGKSAKEENKNSKLTLEVFNPEGQVLEKISLPEEIFGVKINKILIAQAIRVLRANQRQGTSSTKTRGEVEGSTRKIYRQKGTGRARHGSIRAPIFVHGGIVFGPKPRDHSLHMPQKMRRAALFCVLADKYNNGKIKILQGIEKIEPKTKNFVGVLNKLGLNEKKKKLLLISGAEIDLIKRTAGNIKGVSVASVKRLNTYDVLNSKQLVFMKDAVEELKNHFLGKSKKDK